MPTPDLSKISADDIDKALGGVAATPDVSHVSASDIDQALGVAPSRAAAVVTDPDIEKVRAIDNLAVNAVGEVDSVMGQYAARHPEQFTAPPPAPKRDLSNYNDNDFTPAKVVTPATPDFSKTRYKFVPPPGFGQTNPVVTMGPRTLAGGSKLSDKILTGAGKLFQGASNAFSDAQQDPNPLKSGIANLTSSTLLGPVDLLTAMTTAQGRAVKGKTPIQRALQALKPTAFQPMMGPLVDAVKSPYEPLGLDSAEDAATALLNGDFIGVGKGLRGVPAEFLEQARTHPLETIAAALPLVAHGAGVVASRLPAEVAEPLAARPAGVAMTTATDKPTTLVAPELHPTAPHGPNGTLRATDGKLVSPQAFAPDPATSGHNPANVPAQADHIGDAAGMVATPQPPLEAAPVPVETPDAHVSHVSAEDIDQALAGHETALGATPVVSKPDPFRDAAKQRIAAALDRAGSGETYLPPQMAVEIGGKTKQVDTSVIIKELGGVPGGDVNKFRLPAPEPSAPELVPPPSPAPEPAPPATTDPVASAEAPAATPEIAAHGMTMAHVQKVAEGLGIGLPAKSEFTRSFDDIKGAAMSSDFDTEAPPTNPALSPEQAYVGHVRMRELSETVLPSLLKEAETAPTPELQGRIDSAMHEVTDLSQKLYRGGSEAGRRLAFQKALVSDDISPSAVLTRAQAALGGKLSREGAATLTRLSGRAQKTRAAIDARVGADADQAATRIRRRVAATPRDVSDLLPPKTAIERARSGAANKLFKQESFEQANARLKAGLGRVNSGVPLDLLPDLVEWGGYHIERGLRTFGEWSKQLEADFPGRFTHADAQSLWANTRAELQKRVTQNGDARNPRLTANVFVDHLAGKIGRQGAQGFVNAIASADGEHATLQKLIDKTPLSADEEASVQSAYQTHAPVRVKSAQPNALDGLTEVLNKTRTRTAPKPPPMTPARATKMAQKSADYQLGRLEGGMKPLEKVQRADLAAVGVREYANGAKDLATFGKRLRTGVGKDLPDATIQQAFSDAATKYRADYKGLDEIKGHMAETVAREAFHAKPWLSKAGYQWENVVGAGRALLTSFDLSAPGRQGAILFAADPVAGARAMLPMIRAAAKEDAAHAVDAAIKARPNYARAKESGLSLSSTEHEFDLSKAEELYRTNLAEKIPVLGRGINASERAYVTFLNKIRMDTFDSLTRDLESGGTAATPGDLKAISDYINVATGRGDLGKAGNMAAELLNKVFFAPRFAASRFQYLAGQPIAKAALNGAPRAARLVARQYVRSAASAGAILGLAKLAGAQVSLDPRSSDFLKIRVGNTRFDILAGLQQSFVLMVRLATAQKTNGAGAVTPLDGKAMHGSPYDVAGQFARGKLAPLPATVADFVDRKDMMGQPVTPLSEAKKTLVPMNYQDLLQAAKQEGVPMSAAILAAQTLGINASAQEPRHGTGGTMSLRGALGGSMGGTLNGKL